MTDETRQRLLDDIEACELIEQRSRGLNFAEFERNDVVRDAIAFRFVVLGEALNWIRRFDPETAGRIPRLGRIVGIRHRIVHAYDDIDHAIVWDVIVTRLAPLRSRLAALFAAIAEE
jgi:uncharacterized protein with HEPN domain